MKVTHTLGNKNGVISDFSKGVIQTVGDSIGNITESELDTSDYVCVEVEENSYMRIQSMQNVAVRRDQRTTAGIINHENENGTSARMYDMHNRCRSKISPGWSFEAS